MNYDNINDIFSAGVTNMTCLLQDSNSYDGGTLAVSGADFFTFLGKAVPYIYAHGDSYWGIGSDATHLKVDNRDTKMRSLYREEGTFIQLLPFPENTVGRMVALQCIRGGLPVKVRPPVLGHGGYFPSYDFCSCPVL